ncbi:FUSC family protein [Desulfovibrio sp. TomC]|uniref:FUSC family protein n=1 Tax=Desulfovibrio sp. TomC TaxID=1562888 RepID=UPI00057493D5|nr:FUSC family protein [Desulfovibrio sp. TomC]KHK03550.1 hypothetical protein NY78_1138 [Desulfovibrio sp. TomC]
MVYHRLAARESIKTGLAMALACGIALALGWENPYWAAIAVAVVSMPTVGESLNKSALRLGGTVVGGLVGLLSLGLFGQDRFAFTLFMSLYVGWCAYRITVTRAVYFWFISGYVALLIAAAGVGSSSHQAFYTAMLRVQETGLGILVYAFVSVFVWPQRCLDDLKLVVRNLVGVEAKTLAQYFTLLRQEEAGDRTASWYAMENQLVGQLARRLDAAEMEQFEIREVRHWWRRLLRTAQDLMEAMEIWRETFPELRRIDLDAVLPDLPEVERSLQARFRQVVALADGGQPQEPLPAPALPIDQDRLRALPHLQQAAVLTLQATVLEIGALTDRLVTCMRGIKEKRPQGADAPDADVSAVGRQADPDSFMAFLRGMAAVWLSTLVWIAFDPPGHMMLVVFTGIHTLMGVMSPQMRWAKFILANTMGVVIAAVLYVFVMPQLSGYMELSVLLFVLTSVIYYVFWDPRLTMLKFSAIVPFIMLTNIQNHQVYNMISYCSSATAMLLSLPLAAMASNGVCSLRPEKMFVRLGSRYFRQALALMATFATPRKSGWPGKTSASVLSAMQASVGKIGGWANGVDYKLLPQQAPQQAVAMVASLNTLTYRFLFFAAAQPERTPSWPAFDAALEAWRAAIEDVLRQWAARPMQQARECALHGRLAQARAQLENASEASFEQIEGAFTPAQYTRAYRLLGGYRGLYDALVAHAALAAAFDWDAWRESRL